MAPLLLVAALLLPSPALPGAPADRGVSLPPGTPEYQVKAAFLYNFARFVEWPAGVLDSPQAPIVVGVLGDDPFGPVLDEMLAGRIVNGHPLVARRFADLRHLQPCAVLFISGLDAADLEEALRTLQASPVLTVGDGARFARQGGIISFFLENSRVRFQINAEAARRAGLRISSRLLELARAAPESGHADR